MNRTQQQDINDFISSFALADELSGKRILITGATGLIGSTLIRCLLALKRNVNVVAPVRNRRKAEALFGEYVQYIELIECNFLDFDYNNIGKVDYIIHCAAPTSSKFFVEHAVETFDTIIRGTSVLLEYARRNPVRSFVYLSSLEVYGSMIDDSQLVTEDVQGYLDPMNVRSSYPMAKRAAENLCCLYVHEYCVPVKITRLTQTTGAGIARDDNRVIAQFARLAANGKDIVLHTSGESARPYCYITDCITALLHVLLRGEDGLAYNVANEDTYISARDMANYLKEHFCNNINVRIELKADMGYAPVTRLRLSSERLRLLGWRPRYGLFDIFTRLIQYLTE